MEIKSLFKKIKRVDTATKLCLAICFGMLALGLLPYLFIRTSDTHISAFLGKFIPLRQLPLDENGLFYRIMTSFFSDFCWAFSMPFALYAFTQGRLSKSVYTLGIPIIGSAFEFLQYIGVLDGVGDIIDCVLYFVASFLGYLIIERGVTHVGTTSKQQ